MLLARIKDRVAEERGRFSTLILGTTAAYLFMGVAAAVAWSATGQTAWIEYFFQIPGALLLVWLAVAEMALGIRVWRCFGAGEPLRRAWLFIVCSSASAVLGYLYSQLLGVSSKLNPLSHMSNPSPALIQRMRELGLLLGGTVRFAFLAAGLSCVLALYRRSGFMGRLRRRDWLLLGALAVYLVVEYGDVLVALRAGTRFSLSTILGWPVDPLLWLLMGEALLIVRSVQKTGLGWIGRCWAAFSVAIFLTVLGDVGLLATAYDYIPWPLSAVTWFIWMPAAAAFALGPAYQLEAIQMASGELPERRRWGNS